MAHSYRKLISSKLSQLVDKTLNATRLTYCISKDTEDPEIHLPKYRSTASNDSICSVLCSEPRIKDVRLENVGKKQKIIIRLWRDEFIRTTLSSICFDRITLGTSPKTIIEFSSPNIAKPFHAGHLRSAIIGNFLSNLYDHLGHDVTKINYLGDWGTQFGYLKLGVDLKQLTKEDIRRNPIEILYEAYVHAYKEATNDSELQSKARQIFSDLESGKFEDIDTWTDFRSYTVDELKRIYQRLGISFDHFHWESQYGINDIAHVISLMQNNKILLTQNDGRKIIKVGDRNVPIVKSDGTTLYLTRDVAALLDRYERFKFDNAMYVVDNGQNDHFSALVSIAHQMRLPFADNVSHVKFGRVLGMSTRKGTVVFLKDILDEAEILMKQKQLCTKTTKIDVAVNQEVASILGTTAVIVNDLKQRRMRDYDFSWDKALQSDGDSGIKLQYTHCRLWSLQQNIGENAEQKDCIPELLPEIEALHLVCEIAKYDEVLIESAEKQEACILVNYLFGLCVNPAEWKLPESAILADPRFFESGPVDVIIGAEYYMDLLKEEREKATESRPTLQNTVFGCIVSGKIPNSAAVGPSLVHVCSTAEIQDQLTKFWELETCRSTSIHSIEESACEEVFTRTTKRDERGRFVVTLPKKEYVINRLGESKTIAMKRFEGLERRFSRDPELKAQYSDFIHEYRDLGHMREVTEESARGKTYYLPHHAVLKPDSTTTKLRVVFDASCRTSTGVSLNDALMVGPVVQDELLSIILRFRLHRYAVVADVAKMYRMVRVQNEDQPLQRILWIDSPDEQVRTYELTTVTYGTASAPYLATKCLQRLADEGESTHPVAAKVLKKDFYVDDMLSGVDEIEEGKEFVLQSAEFSLRKWNSNSPELLLNVPEHLRDDRSILQLDSSSTTVKTLGLVWEPSTDSFHFSSPTWNSTAVITKRTVLSDVSRLFDPLGLVGPVIVQAKIFVQELWKQECGWDEPLTRELQEQWSEYRRNLAGLEGLSAQRWVGSSPNIGEVEIHGFCDASEKAYGACLYLRTILENGETNVQLLASKSRVAPLENLKKGKKRQSIPRLELSSALLLAHVYDKVVHSLGIQAKAYFWTDSMIVKCWLASSPSRWKEFVANRVSEIQHLTKGSIWNHVSGIENPADIISRGMTPAQLQYQSIWFHGPNWLRLEEANWPKSQQIPDEALESTDLEEKSISAVLPAIAPSEIFGLRSCLTDLERLTALMQRFRFNTQAANRIHRR